MTHRLLETPTHNIVFLPTAGQDDVNPWHPNTRGVLRIEAAGKRLEVEPDAVLVIAGGWPNHRGFTYADRMTSYIAQHHAKMLERLVLVSGRYNRTVDDLFQGMLLLAGLFEEQNVALMPAETTLHFCSETPHFNRTKATIQTLGFNAVCAVSGADHSIYSDADVRMSEEVVLGKIFGLGAEAIEWQRRALQGTAAKAVACQEWASRNPLLDEQHYNDMQDLLRTLSANGVYMESPALAPVRSRPPIPTFLG